jgi:predicted nucleic acid-binding protein
MGATSAIKAVGCIVDVARIITLQQDTHPIALVLIEKYELKSNRDICLVATTLSNGSTTIATDNTNDFKVYD